MIPNICFFYITIVFEVIHLWHPQKMTNKWPPSPSSTIHKNEQIYCLKRIESANTRQTSRSPHPLVCERHKCVFPFWFFKIWPVTCLKANEILNFIKIQLSYLLLSYQKNTKLIFPTISVIFWILFWWVYVSNHYQARIQGLDQRDWSPLKLDI